MLLQFSNSAISLRLSERDESQRVTRPHPCLTIALMQRKEQELAQNGSRENSGPKVVTAEDGMRHVLLTVPAPKLYRCVHKPYSPGRL